MNSCSDLLSSNEEEAHDMNKEVDFFIFYYHCIKRTLVRALPSYLMIEQVHVITTHLFKNTITLRNYVHIHFIHL